MKVGVMGFAVVHGLFADEIHILYIQTTNSMTNSQTTPVALKAAIA